MELITIHCPFCSEVTELAYTCCVCGNDLRLLVAAKDLALTYYNHALEMIKENAWENAWQDISKAINIFPYHPEIVQLAWRLSRELGYFNDALTVLESCKSMLEPNTYENAINQLHNEVKYYNSLLEGSGKPIEHVPDLMVFESLRMLKTGKNGRPCPPKPVRKFSWIAAGFILVLGVINVLQLVHNRKSGITINNDAATSESLVDTLTEQSNLDYVLSMPANDQVVIFRLFWKHGYYEQLSKVDSQNWHVRSAKYMLVSKEIRNMEKDPQNANKSIASLDEWTRNNADFPSYYGDACLELIDIYSSPPHQDQIKQKIIAERLFKWVQSMPERKEYRQYLNNKVLEILNG